MAGFVHRMRVRYGECDAQGIVFNANYMAYVDHSLTELWRDLFGGYAVMTERGVDVMVAETNVRFLGSARFDEEIDSVVSVTHLGTTSMVLLDDIVRVAGGELLVRARTRYVWITADDHIKTPIPDWARASCSPGTWSPDPEP